ncbi:MAG: hypothetical protein RH947_11365 [Alcanivorax sp.]|jgi:preprotein translocase subunit SecB
MLKSAPIQLVDYFFNEISVKRNDRLDWNSEINQFNDGKMSVYRDIRFPISDNHSLIAIQLKFLMQEDESGQPPIIASIDMQGLFEIHGSVEWSLEDKIRFVGVSGASILYGIIREQITGLSSRVIPGAKPFIVPTISFDPDGVNAEEVIAEHQIEQ